MTSGAPDRPSAVRSLVVGTAGHIDHGKSALVRALTGTDPDRLKEERARGITIDLGFAHAAIGDCRVAFVDVPGHERFVRNMLAGAGGIDAVLLVVAADEAVMPQTREHFDICRLLGIERGVVALTKCDLVDAETRELGAVEVAELLAGSPLADAPVVPVSSVTGEGLDALRDALAALAGVRPKQARDGVARLPVDRAFTVRGFGTVVTGTLVSGRIAVGDTLDVLPGGATARVRGLQVHGVSVEWAAAPCRVAVNLGAMAAGAVPRGVTLATSGALAPADRIDLRMQVLPGAKPIRHGARLRMHHGTSETLGRVSIAAVREGGQSGWTVAHHGDTGVEVPPGGEALVRLRVERPAVVTRGDRVVFRAYSPVATVAGGRVLDPEPPRGGVRRPGSAGRFEALDGPELPLALWLDEGAGRGVDAAMLVCRGGASPDEAAVALDAAVAAGRAVRAGQRAFSSPVAEQVGARVLAVIAAYHEAEPLEPGVPRERLREEAAPGVATELFDHVLLGLVGTGEVAGTDRLALASHRPTLSEREASLEAAIEAAVREAGLVALDAPALAAATGASTTELDAVVRHLQRHGRIVRLEDFVVDADALARLKAAVRAQGARALPSTPAEIDVAAFKAQFGLTRKHAIPLLEWLDRERITRRMGNRRVVVG